MNEYRNGQKLAAHRPLTKRQQEILAFITDECIAGAPPTRRAIADHFGFSSANAVTDHLKQLAKKGKVAMITGSRGIRVVGLDDPVLHGIIRAFLSADEAGRQAMASMVMP